MTRAPVIFGCAGRTLGADERRFFAATKPIGFILFQRNCVDPTETRALVEDLRAAISDPDAPVLIDQEGGRVARLKPPHWPSYPAAAEMAALGGARAAEAVRLHARLIAADLADLGITVDCLPVLDLRVPGADAVIGDRAYGARAEEIVPLARAACEGLLAGGVLPVVKHIPGHGRATVDSHLACPVVTEPHAVLSETDFAPFRALADMPWAMTAHVVYAAIDADRPATLSPVVIDRVIRGEIGFDGVLVSDDLSMQALGGGLGARAATALGAGCDIVLHCNGKLDEMAEIAAVLPPMTAAAAARLARAAGRLAPPLPLDRPATRARFDALFATA